MYIKTDSTKVGISIGNEITFYDLADIVYCESEGNYTKVVLSNQKEITTAKKLKDLESSLPEDLFVRVHHSFIINMMHVLTFHNDDRKTLKMTNGKEIVVSRRKKSYFLTKFIKL